MSNLSEQLSQLTDAEDFLKFFDVPFEQQIVHVNRLHILKRFNQYVRRETGLSTQTEEAAFAIYRRLLSQAYDDFVRSTPAKEKVFKVFQDAEGQHVSVDSLRTTLPSLR